METNSCAFGQAYSVVGTSTNPTETHQQVVGAPFCQQGDSGSERLKDVLGSRSEAQRQRSGPLCCLIVQPLPPAAGAPWRREEPRLVTGVLSDLEACRSSPSLPLPDHLSLH